MVEMFAMTAGLCGHKEVSGEEMGALNDEHVGVMI
jgi:hypothetical protein